MHTLLNYFNLNNSKIKTGTIELLFRDIILIDNINNTIYHSIF